MAERRQQLEELFHAALEREPDERASFLSEACASDPGLRAEVESLISAHEQPGGLLDSPAYELAAGLIADSDVESLVGRSIGQYEVVAFIGRGGMGNVYLARDTRLDRKVALKLLPLRFTTDEIRLRRFMLEARAASSLNHPNIITIHEIGQVGSVHFIATEFIEGQTLRHLLAGGRMKLRDALDVAIQAAGALSAAHAAGIVHRDIKPENIMLRPDGYVKTLDFGLAKLTERQAPAPDTKSPTAPMVDTDPGIVMGTVNYMSPEQARGRGVDARSDIFNLGVVIYEMITGRQPFGGDTTADVIASILKTEPPPLADFAPDSPAELQQIVSRALSKDKEERYQTIEEMLVDLKAVKHELEFGAKRDQSSIVVTEPASRAFKRAFSRRLALLILLVAILGGAVWWLIQPDTDWLSDLQLVPLHDWKSELGGSQIGCRFSPDGKTIAYYSTQDGRLTIWVKQTDGGDPIRLTRDEWNYWSPVWSPDSQQIAVASNRGNQIGIWLLPLPGGAPTLLSALEPGGWRGLPELTRWSKNGATIYYEWKRNLFGLDVASKETTQITNFDPSTSLAFKFAVSPDEDRIAYTDSREEKWDIWVMPMEGGAPVQVTNDPAEDINPVWHPDGKRVIYSSEREDTFHVCMAHLDGRKPLQITRWDTRNFVADVSEDGAKILYFASKEESDIWGVKIDTAEEFAITSALGVEFWPDISPDGKMITFQATRGPGAGIDIRYCSILARPIETISQEIQLASNGFDPKWSPDGRKLAFLRTTGVLYNIWTVNATGGDEKQVTTRGIYFGGHSVLPYNREDPSAYSWSRDGGKIVYCSKTSGPSNVWVVSADGSNEAQISSNTVPNLILSHPLWSPDESRLVYRSAVKPSAGAKSVWSLWLTGQGISEIIFQADYVLRPVGWFPTGSDLVIAVNEKEANKGQPITVKLLRISADDGGRRTIARLESTYFANIQLSPDGRNIAFVSRRDGSDNIWVVRSSGGKARKITHNIDPRLFFSSLTWSPDGKAVYYGMQVANNYISMIDNFR